MGEQDVADRSLPGQFLRAFWYPLLGQGKYVLGGYLVFVVALNFAQRLPLVGFAFCLMGLLFTLYLWAYFMRIVASSANGEKELPDWPSAADAWRDVDLLILGTVVFCFGPVIVYQLILPRFIEMPGGLFWPLLILGCFCFPMALLSVVLHDSLTGLNPVLLIWSIFKVRWNYLFCFAMIVLAAVLFYLSFAILPIPLIGVVLPLYIIMVIMHVVGLLYYANSERLCWFE